MIKCKKGNIKVQGSTEEVEADLTCVLISVRESLEKKLGKEQAAEEVRECIRLSFLSAEEVEREMLKEREKLMHEIKESLRELFQG